MAEQAQSTSLETNAWRRFQRYRNRLLVATALISLIIHFASFEGLGGYRRKFDLSKLKKDAVKVRIVEKKPEEKKKKVEDEALDPDIPKILETPQTKTEKPDEADYVGTVDHKAVKEMRLADEVKRERAKDAGQKGKPDAQTDAPVNPNLANQPKPQKIEKQNKDTVQSKTGKLTMDAFRPKPRNDYEALLPTSIADLPGQLDAGFQDYVDDKIQNGDRIDINTTEYRYIGYFTNMRKAIELVWNYPIDAARKGLQGEVGLEFAINKDGKATHIRVIKSSGYEILDKAIVEAIKLASPFSPLPEGFKRQKIVVTGSFRYILNAYGSH